MRASVALSLLILVTSLPFQALSAAEATATADLQGEKTKLTSKGIAFLRRSQNEDGSFSPELGPAITSLATTALLRNGVPESDPVVAKALEYVEQFVKEDGGIYQEGSLYRNYETSVAMMCFAEVKAPRFTEHMQRAQKFIIDIQTVGAQEDPAYGGAGYGKHKRPDLSNTTFFIEALKQSGLSEDDPAMQRALKFVSRCQNLESEHNTTAHANKVNDGGFYYTSAAGGSSQAGTIEATGGLRSYGSMTYAGLKSLIFAGVDRDDARVKAAVEWIGKNYDLDKNPGMLKPYEGLYYYYHTFAKCLNAIGDDMITDEDGNQHNWQADLIETLAKKQQDNGSWVNDTDRWLEGDAELVTGYALLSLSYCE